MSCVYCNHYILYKLKNGYYKCAKCKRKFSPKKIERKAKILHSFLLNKTPSEIAKKYNFSYKSVVNEIFNIRQVMAQICEEEFLKKHEIIEFNEYLYIPYSKKKDYSAIYKAQNFLTIDYGNKVYIPHSKKKDYSSIYKAQNFLTIDYGNKVYNILLSNMKNYDNLTPEEIKKILRQSHIIKIKKNITIPLFWEYFEKFILKFKGIKEENFFLYLKEAEFRFNKFKIEIKDLFKI